MNFTASVQLENSAWVVWKTFYIHDGADNPTADAYGTIGCVKVVGESQNFLRFNEYIIALSGAAGRTRDEKLIAIGKSGKLSITYQKSARPPLVVQNP